MCGPTWGRGTGRSLGRATGATHRGTRKSVARRTPIAVESYVARRCKGNIRICRRWRAYAQKSAGSCSASCAGPHEADTSGKVQQHPNRLENQVRFDTGQEMSPTLEHRADGLVTQEVAIPQQEHIFLEQPEQVMSHGDLATGLWLDQEAPQHMAAGFAKGQDAGLGKCGWGTAASGATERTVVGRGIGHINDESVERHGPHAAVECAGRSWLTLQTDDLIGQEPQRGDAETFARLAKGRSSWGSAAAKRL